MRYLRIALLWFVIAPLFLVIYIVASIMDGVVLLVTDVCRYTRIFWED